MTYNKDTYDSMLNMLTERKDMIYGYIRVSTDKQNVKNQYAEISNFALKNNLKIDKWIKETISSTIDLEKRKLHTLLKRMKQEDILITSELSRLGRNLLQIMSILHYCMKINAQVWTIKDNYRLGADIQSKVLAFAFGLSAEIERNLISERTREALRRLKSEGKKIGRQTGSKNVNHKLDGKETVIADLLDKKVPKLHIARMMGCSRVTLYQFLNKMSRQTGKIYISHE